MGPLCAGPPAVGGFAFNSIFNATESCYFWKFPFEVGGGAAASPLFNILTGGRSSVSMLKSQSEILDKRSASPSEPHQGTDVGPQLMKLKAHSGSYSSSRCYGKQLLLLRWNPR